LNGKHRADLRAVENIEKKRLNDIVLVMPQRDLVAFETMGKTEKTFPSFPGTEKTRIFSILRAIRLHPDIRELDVPRESSCLKEIPQDLTLGRIKTEVNVNRQEFVMDGNSPASLMKEMEE
jgi:hypothetical protein